MLAVNHPATSVWSGLNIDLQFQTRQIQSEIATMELLSEKETDNAADFTASDTSLGKKKRSNSEAAEYPRRRATIAVSTFDIVKDKAY
jgi:hypothetical protein